ncbi:hypothetical protein RRG08_060864 [Elysia crispata]|uniref:Uncharacterized protein n=1 Tax=Elysia crispata TaxID=231223 RepID=A0AAE0ZFR7_9GAST|nr:hypothetical protein RRG08_060864 [Elysia crispata]
MMNVSESTQHTNVPDIIWERKRNSVATYTDYGEQVYQDSRLHGPCYMAPCAHVTPTECTKIVGFMTRATRLLCTCHTNRVYQDSRLHGPVLHGSLCTCHTNRVYEDSRLHGPCYKAPVHMSHQQSVPR